MLTVAYRNVSLFAGFLSQQADGNCLLQYKMSYEDQMVLVVEQLHHPLLNDKKVVQIVEVFN